MPPDEVDMDALAARLRADVDAPVPPLDASAARALAHALTGRTPRSRADALAALDAWRRARRLRRAHEADVAAHLRSPKS